MIFCFLLYYFVLLFCFIILLDYFVLKLILLLKFLIRNPFSFYLISIIIIISKSNEQKIYYLFCNDQQWLSSDQNNNSFLVWPTQIQRKHFNDKLFCLASFQLINKYFKWLNCYWVWDVCFLFNVLLTKTFQFERVFLFYSFALNQTKQSSEMINLTLESNKLRLVLFSSFNLIHF